MQVGLRPRLRSRSSLLDLVRSRGDGLQIEQESSSSSSSRSSSVASASPLRSSSPLAASSVVTSSGPSSSPPSISVNLFNSPATSNLPASSPNSAVEIEKEEEKDTFAKSKLAVVTAVPGAATSSAPPFGTASQLLSTAGAPLNSPPASPSQPSTPAPNHPPRAPTPASTPPRASSNSTPTAASRSKMAPVRPTTRRAAVGRLVTTQNCPLFVVPHRPVKLIRMQ